MPFSPSQLVAGMPQDVMINIINENFRQIESENRTKVMRDEDGVNRILFGKAPNGEWLLAITEKGVDVLEALPK